MNRDEYDDREPLELVMPFVAVQSKGGPYDDASFAAGWTAAAIDTALYGRSIAATSHMVRTDLVAQLDLIGMRYGYRVDTLTVLDDGWTHLGLTRIEEWEQVVAP